MNRIEIDVIDRRDEQAALLTWAARVEAGEVQRSANPRMHFASYRQLPAVLTEKRMVLLEYVAMHESLSIRQLAGELDRDYRNVYDDVQRLVQLGLIEIQDGKLHGLMKKSTFERLCVKHLEFLVNPFPDQAALHSQCRTSSTSVLNSSISSKLRYTLAKRM